MNNFEANKRLRDVALGREPADTVIKGATIVQVHRITFRSYLLDFRLNEIHGCGEKVISFFNQLFRFVDSKGQEEQSWLINMVIVLINDGDIPFRGWQFLM